MKKNVLFILGFVISLIMIIYSVCIDTKYYNGIFIHLSLLISSAISLLLYGKKKPETAWIVIFCMILIGIMLIGSLLFFR